jgi:acetylornithine deacetylase/succinyl-diaminopimelate desuccinylase-like protein
VRIRIEGEPQSTFSKDKALDPMPKALDLYRRLQEWEGEYQAAHPHPLFKLLVGIGAIHGGMPYKPSITPSSCSLYLHVNMLPGQSILGVKRELEALIERQRADDPDLRASVDIFVASNGYEIEFEHRLPQAVAAAHREVFGEDVTRPNPERYSVSSDNSPLYEFGIPGITYGAGGLNFRGEYSSYEPGVGEVVSVDNLAACARVYAAAAVHLLDGRDGADATA